MNDINRLLHKDYNKRLYNPKTNKDNLEKYILQLNSELNKLYSARSKLGKIEITPYHDGYIRYLIINEKYNNHPLANKLYPIIKNKIWCRDKSFMQKDYMTRKKHEVKLYPKSLYKKYYNKLSDKLKTYFYLHIEKYGGHKYKLYDNYHKYFTYKQKKYYVTHKYIINPDIEKRITEIDNILTNNNYYPKLNKITIGRNHYKDDYDLSKYKKLKRNLNKELQLFLNFNEY